MVIGIARSGLSVARLLKRHGFDVFVSEIRPEPLVAEQASILRAENIPFETGGHSPERVSLFDFVIPSPGVPETIPILAQAKEKGLPIFSEIEAASWFCRAPIIGITGSNGKTTTTSLIGAFVRSQYPQSFVGGNIGIPFSEAAGNLPNGAYAVLELSSFQLERIRSFHPRVAVLLNFSPDHLDRHASYQDYIDAKCRIFENQTSDDVLVFNAEDEAVVNAVQRARSRKIPFDTRPARHGSLYVDDGIVKYFDGHQVRKVIPARELKLQGRHNLANIAAAMAAASAVGVPWEKMTSELKRFRPIEHRLEFVLKARGIRFYNDSKATNSDAARQALESFDKPVLLLAGGLAKEHDYSHLAPLVKRSVKKAFLFGEARQKLRKDLGLAKNGRAELFRDLESAFRQAVECARTGDILLLAPMCASFDQYRSFEERGRHFKRLVFEFAEKVKE